MTVNDYFRQISGLAFYMRTPWKNLHILGVPISASNRKKATGPLFIF
ncbi:ribonucleotide-diphosphate reductase alpha subunit [Bacillus sp. NRRL B-14911]|uniref:Uncharacterized protein n=1 Tax=Bacillus infantis NRRL B-14911 TaxID=1367477 RepID=U5LDD6_9BACI|nr:hypothetical protein N288_17960 [Bacillus infantis NRRL B-14911]EAR65194.1 ribonucleotide-diphosphate reductase alpha subunit [Bacillus sp. NRRL B-14911]